MGVSEADTLRKEGGASSQPPITTDADSDTSASTPSDGQGAEDTESEDLFAGKYGSVEDLEKAYKELEKKLGDHKSLEEKAAAYDHLSKAQQRPSDQRPVTAADFVSQDGTVDWVGYNAYMQQQVVSQAKRAAQEQVDVDRSERDFDYLRTDRDAADAVMAMYRSGAAPTIYDAAQRLDKIRNAAVPEAKREAAQEKEREIAQKVRSGSERASAKATDSKELTLESFSKLSLEEKRKIVNQFGPVGS